MVIDMYTIKRWHAYFITLLTVWFRVTCLIGHLAGRLFNHATFSFPAEGGVIKQSAIWSTDPQHTRDISCVVYIG